MFKHLFLNSQSFKHVNFVMFNLIFFSLLEEIQKKKNFFLGDEGNICLKCLLLQIKT